MPTSTSSENPRPTGIPVGRVVGGRLQELTRLARRELANTIVAMISAPHHQITVEEYHRMIDAGAFAPEARLELLDGELIAMASTGNRHFLAVRSLGEQITLAIGRSSAWCVSIQSPVVMPPDSEPEPDLVIARRTRAKPYAEEVRLVCEVSDATRQYDRLDKLPRYARAGIPEAWIVDLTEDRIEVHTEPGTDGYRALRLVRTGDALLIPTTSLAVDLTDIFG